MTNDSDFIVTDEDYEDWLKRQTPKPEPLPRVLWFGIGYAIAFSLPLWALIVWIIWRLP